MNTVTAVSIDAVVCSFRRLIHACTHCFPWKLIRFIVCVIIIAIVITIIVILLRATMRILGFDDEPPERLPSPLLHETQTIRRRVVLRFIVIRDGRYYCLRVHYGPTFLAGSRTHTPGTITLVWPLTFRLSRPKRVTFTDNVAAVVLSGYCASHIVSFTCLHGGRVSAAHTGKYCAWKMFYSVPVNGRFNHG